MTETKYGKYILRQTKKKATKKAAIPVALEGVKDWAGIKPRMNWHHIMAPEVLQKEPISYKYDKYLCFMGSDPKDSFDFGAEVEITIGKEVEKHKFSEATIICIPKGTLYGPIKFNKVTKPIICVEIAQGSGK